MSKDKSILFSTPNIQAVLSGAKTQTRMVIKPQPIGEVRQDSEGNFGEDYGGGAAMNKSERDEIRARCEAAIKLINQLHAANRLEHHEYNVLHDAIDEAGDLYHEGNKSNSKKRSLL